MSPRAPDDARRQFLLRVLRIGAATTNPDVVAERVRLCRAAGARPVIEPK